MITDIIIIEILVIGKSYFLIPWFSCLFVRSVMSVLSIVILCQGIEKISIKLQLSHLFLHPNVLNLLKNKTVV